MIIQPRSLSRVILPLLLISASALANAEYCPKTFDVVERDKKDGYDFVPRELGKLYCNNRFEGEHFKIVNAKEEVAIGFDHKDELLKKKAANVYYHLMKARDFWIKEIKSDFVGKLPQITIRLDIINAFSNIRHFKNEEQEKNFNNAWSIPEGQTPRFAKEQKKWGKEIWFSPMKKIETRNMIESDGSNPIHESLILIKDPIVDYNKNRMLYGGLSLARTSALNNSNVLDLAIKSLAPIAVIYGLMAVTKHIDHWFVDKYYFVETALVPEIIYHEYAHIAMSDTMKTVHSVPVIEGMADYFAARIADRRQMYKKMKKISSNKSKDTKSQTLYHPYLEGAWNATSDFTLSLLWRGKLEFDKVNEQRMNRGQDMIVNYDQIVHEAHLDLTENSDIANDLTSALINSCNKNCKSKRAGINTLQYVFEQKGLN